MDIYTAIKALHVAFVVIWVGGDFSFLVFSLKIAQAAMRPTSHTSFRTSSSSRSMLRHPRPSAR